MNNIIKMLSVNNDFRVVLADTKEISTAQLANFTGNNFVRDFLERIITNCVLLSAINDFDQKISFSLRLINNNSVFCMIDNSTFSMRYTDSINDQNLDPRDLFDEKSLLSITIGDWNTGLHTGMIEANIDSVEMLFASFSVQSEQLPSHFIPAGSTRGLMLQPLPFADQNTMKKNDEEFVYLASALEQTNWENAFDLYTSYAKLIKETKIN